MTRLYLFIPLFAACMGPCCHPDVQWGMSLSEAVNAMNSIQEGCSVFEITTGPERPSKILVLVDNTVPKWMLKGYREDRYPIDCFYKEIDAVRGKSSEDKSISKRVFDMLTTDNDVNVLNLNEVSRYLDGDLAGIVVGSSSYMDDFLLGYFPIMNNHMPGIMSPHWYFYTENIRFVSHTPFIDQFLCSTNGTFRSSVDNATNETASP